MKKKKWTKRKAFKVGQELETKKKGRIGGEEMRRAWGRKRYEQ
jgi:hypothetical protein